jgi:predicted ester cyclase
MSLEDNVAAVHKMYDELNHNNLDVIDEVMSPDFTAHGETMSLDPNNPDRRAAIKQGVMIAKQIFPDLWVTVDDTVAQGDKVVSRMTWRGTQKDPFMGVPPSGQTITWTGIAINRFDQNGKMVERWFNSDELGMMRSMGMIPPMGGGQGGGGQDGGQWSQEGNQ